MLPTVTSTHVKPGRLTASRVTHLAEEVVFCNKCLMAIEVSPTKEGKFKLRSHRCRGGAGVRPDVAIPFN